MSQENTKTDNFIDRKKVLILWSGGWDGTFRLLQLAQNDIVIQPIYLIDKKRKSTKYELMAMQKILKEVRTRYIASVEEILYYDVEWILENCKNEIISNHFNYLREKYNIGTQYEWFALLGDGLGIQMETAVVHQYHGKVEEAIEREAAMVRLSNDFLAERYVVKAVDNNAVNSVFKNLIFPVIKLSKKDEEKIARENGWIDIMELSWFCHNPIKNKPCGLCGPCDDAMNTGMEWRMPLESKKRYKYKKYYSFLRRVKMKLENRFKYERSKT